MSDSLKGIYMDNAATAFPKAPKVVDAMTYYLTQLGGNVSRSTSKASFEAQGIIYETRVLLAELLDCDDPSHIILTKNITESLNILIKGLFTRGDHVIVSPLEHNAVMRPLKALESEGVSFSRATCAPDGSLNLDAIAPLIQKNTKAIIMTHASNVCGTILDLESVAAICKSHGLFFIIDAAQTLGVVPVSMKKLQADAIAFTGHKGLLGPEGTGGFAITPELAKNVKPLIVGGTGSQSELEEQPMTLPDKFEAGTPNTVGIFGLHAALKYLKETGIEALHNKELELTEHFLAGIRPLKGVELVGRDSISGRTAVVSVNFIDQDNSAISWQLEQDFGIITRVGLHCAPAAHIALGSYPMGTVRFSFSPFTTKEEVDDALTAIKSLCK